MATGRDPLARLAESFVRPRQVLQGLKERDGVEGAGGSVHVVDARVDGQPEARAGPFAREGRDVYPLDSPASRARFVEEETERATHIEQRTRWARAVSSEKSKTLAGVPSMDPLAGGVVRIATGLFAPKVARRIQCGRLLRGWKRIEPREAAHRAGHIPMLADREEHPHVRTAARDARSLPGASFGVSRHRNYIDRA